MTLLNTSGEGLRVNQNIPASELYSTAEVTSDKTLKSIVVDFGAGCPVQTVSTEKEKYCSSIQTDLF